MYPKKDTGREQYACVTTNDWLLVPRLLLLQCIKLWSVRSIFVSVTFRKGKVMKVTNVIYTLSVLWIPDFHLFSIGRINIISFAGKTCSDSICESTFFTESNAALRLMNTRCVCRIYSQDINRYRQEINFHVMNMFSICATNQFNKYI